MKLKRTTGLTVFVILSLVWMGMSLYTSIGESMQGPLTDEQIREQKIAMLEEQSEEMLKNGAWVIEDIVEMLNISKDQFNAMSIINYLCLTIGIVGVMLMFQLRRIGFHLYIIYTLITLGYWTYFFAGITLGNIAIGFSILFSALFVFLYAKQIQQMR